MGPGLELLMSLRVELKAPIITIGKTDRGFLRLIPITGGAFSGERMEGTIVPGGYDWNTEVDERHTHLYARYALRTSDGVHISVENEGWLDRRCPGRSIVTAPRFEVGDDKYDFLRKRVFVGSLETVNASDFVELRFYGFGEA